MIFLKKDITEKEMKKLYFKPTYDIDTGKIDGYKQCSKKYFKRDNRKISILFRKKEKRFRLVDCCCYSAEDIEDLIKMYKKGIIELK